MIRILTKKEQEDFIQETYLRMCDPDEVKVVLAEASRQRLENRSGNNGYSPNKNMRKLADIPRSVYFNPKFRHIFHNPDPVEGERLRRKFLRTNHKLLCVDKI